MYNLLPRSQACNDLCMGMSSICTTTVSEECILHPTLVKKLNQPGFRYGQVTFGYLIERIPLEPSAQNQKVCYIFMNTLKNSSTQD